MGQKGRVEIGKSWATQYSPGSSSGESRFKSGIQRNQANISPGTGILRKTTRPRDDTENAPTFLYEGGRGNAWHTRNETHVRDAVRAGWRNRKRPDITFRENVPENTKERERERESSISRLSVSPAVFDRKLVTGSPRQGFLAASFYVAAT